MNDVHYQVNSFEQVDDDNIVAEVTVSGLSDGVMERFKKMCDDNNIFYTSKKVGEIVDTNTTQTIRYAPTYKAERATPEARS